MLLTTLNQLYCHTQQTLSKLVLTSLYNVREMYTKSLSNDQKYRGSERRVVRQRFELYLLHFINTVHLIPYSSALLGY